MKPNELAKSESLSLAALVDTHAGFCFSFLEAE